MNMPNELINLIFSFKETNPVNQIMKTTIKDWKNSFKGRRRERFYNYYFSITNARVRKLKENNLNIYNQRRGRNDITIYEIKKYYDYLPINKRYGTREQVIKRSRDFDKLVPSPEYRERMRLQKMTYSTYRNKNYAFSS